MAIGKMYRVKKSTMMARPSWEKPVSKKTVRKMIKKSEETKIFTAPTASSSAGNTWTFNVLSNVAKGDDINSRDGNTIEPLSLRARIRMAVNAANTTGEEIRVVFLRDKQARGAVPTSANLGLADNSTGDLVHMKDIDNFYSRFQILSDKIYTFDTTQKIRTVKTNLKIKGKMKFGTEGADYEDNAIFVAVWSKDNTNTAPVDIISRLYYKDA